MTTRVPYLPAGLVVTAQQGQIGVIHRCQQEAEEASRKGQNVCNDPEEATPIAFKRPVSISIG